MYFTWLLPGSVLHQRACQHGHLWVVDSDPNTFPGHPIGVRRMAPLTDRGVVVGTPSRAAAPPPTTYWTCSDRALARLRLNEGTIKATWLRSLPGRGQTLFPK